MLTNGMSITYIKGGLMMSRIKTKVLGLLLVFTLTLSFANYTTVFAEIVECENPSVCTCGDNPLPPHFIAPGEIKPRNLT